MTTTTKKHTQKKAKRIIEFSKFFTLANTISAIMIAGCIILIASKGLNYGVDFRGGAEIHVNFFQEVDLGKFRDKLEEGGFSGSSVQSVGDPANHDYLIKVQAKEGDEGHVTDAISAMLQKEFSDVGAKIEKTDIVGPKAGEQLRTSGFQSIFFALIAILVYIGLRFELKYAPGAIIALTHDVLIVLGIWSLLGMEFTLQTLAALLAVIGYSVNDTVVVSDRVHEHERSKPGLKLVNHINAALSETMTRTILTSATTLFVSVSMYMWGGKSIEEFFLAITIGVLFGTYSSVFIAAPAILFFEKVLSKNKKKLA